MFAVFMVHDEINLPAELDAKWGIVYASPLEVCLTQTKRIPIRTTERKIIFAEIRTIDPRILELRIEMSLLAEAQVEIKARAMKQKSVS